MIVSSKSRNHSISASHIFLTINSNNLMEFHFEKILKVLNKFSTFSGVPVNLSLKEGSWLHTPTGHVFE